MALNAQHCELCAQNPPDQWLRERYADGGAITKRATNRTRLDAYYAEKAGHPEWAGLMICRDCGRVISDRINGLI